MGCWLVIVPSPATASSSPGPSQPLSGESRVRASPRPARDLSQEPSAARKGAVCRPAPGALEEECGLINSPKRSSEGLALWEQLPGQACQAAAGPACRSLSAGESEGDGRQGAGRQGFRGLAPCLQAHLSSDPFRAKNTTMAAASRPQGLTVQSPCAKQLVGAPTQASQGPARWGLLSPSC